MTSVYLKIYCRAQSVKTLKIGQHLPKLCLRIKAACFFLDSRCTSIQRVYVDNVTVQVYYPFTVVRCIIQLACILCIVNLLRDPLNNVISLNKCRHWKTIRPGIPGSRLPAAVGGQPVVSLDGSTRGNRDDFDECQFVFISSSQVRPRPALNIHWLQQQRSKISFRECPTR